MEPDPLRRPDAACVVLTEPSDRTVVPLPTAIRSALGSGAEPVVVLCAVGEPLPRARERLRALDLRLVPLAAELSARVSRSATDGLAAWAASPGTPIGVDVQQAPAALDADLLDAALHADERCWLVAQPNPTRAFAMLWAAKEAVLKAFGVGLAWPPREVCVLPATAGWHAVQVPALGRAWFSHLDVPGTPNVALAVALNAGHAAPG